MKIRLGIVWLGAWASLASASSKPAPAPPVQAAAAAPRAPAPRPALVQLCTMDEDCPQGEHCCEQMGSPVCCGSR